MKANLLERAIMVISPKTAYNRQSYKMALRSFYSAADISSRSEGWTAVNATGEKINQGDRDIIRARARDLERNSDMLPSQILSLERNVVGTGLVLQAKINKPDGNSDEELNSKIEDLWREWCKPQNCDITGRMSFEEIQEICVRRRFVDGGILILKVYENNNLKLQLKEVDCLDISIPYFGENRVIGGIELDKYDKAIAYHIREGDAFGYSKTVRIPADRVCCLSYLTRPSQIREVSPAAPSLKRIDDTNELIGSAVMKERVLSYFGMFITSTGSGGGGGFGRGISESKDKNKVYTEEALEQGMIKRLPPGEDVKTINPSGISSTAADMARLTQRLSGSSVGLSYEASSRDMSQVTYSSARQGGLEDQRTYKRWQAYLITHLCENIYLEWLDWIVLKGLLNINDYYKNKSKYQKCVWISSGWEWIDPLKESKANTEALDSGQKTLQDICAANGKDWRDVIKQRGIEIEMQNKYTLNQNTDDKDTENATKEDKEPKKSSDIKGADKAILNGAQIDSLVNIVQLVAAGAISFDSAKMILTSAYLFDDATASNILNGGKLIAIGDDNKNAKQ